MENGNKPAYPMAGYELSNSANSERFYHVDGLTKREMFAMAAMQGLMSYEFSFDRHELSSAENVARKAIRAADELLKQLSQPPI